MYNFIEFLIISHCCQKICNCVFMLIYCTPLLFQSLHRDAFYYSICILWLWSFVFFYFCLTHKHSIKPDAKFIMRYKSKIKKCSAWWSSEAETWPGQMLREQCHIGLMSAIWKLSLDLQSCGFNRSSVRPAGVAQLHIITQ